jgi:hypothetical protein
MLGVLPGQIGALASWLVWGQGRFLRRLAIHWASALALWLSAIMGCFVGASPPREAANGIIATICLLPLVSLIVQAPLWPLRIYLGWKVERPDQLRSGREHALSIGDILAGTAVTALSLGLLRAWPHVDFGVNIPWTAFAIVGICILGASLFGLLPVLVVVLRCRKASTALAGYAALALFSLVVMIFAVGSRGVRVEEVLVVVVVMVVPVCSFAVTLAAPWLVYRAAGYRLVWSRLLA